MAKSKEEESVQEGQPEQGLAQVQPDAFASMMATAATAPTEVLRDEDGRPVGMEVEADKLEVPRLALVQKQSRVTDENLAQAGQMFSTLLGEALWPLPHHFVSEPAPPHLSAFVVPGSTPSQMGLPFLPLKVFDDRVLFDDSMSLQCRSMPGGRRTVQGFKSPAWNEGDPWDPTLCESCPLKDWPVDGKPACSLTYNVIGFALNHAGHSIEEMLGIPMAATFSNSSARTGRMIASTIRMNGANPWATIWVLWATQEKNDKGSFYVWRAKQAQVPGTHKAVATPPELAAYAAMMYENLSGRKLDIDRETFAAAAVEEPTGGAVGDSDDPWS